MSSSCTHTSLVLEPSRYASVAGYQRPTARQIADAMSTEPTKASASRGTSKRPQASQDTTLEYSAGTFPAPIVLPNDDLAWDPECPGQDMREWLGERKKISAKAKRKVIYVAAPPAVSEDASFVSGWTTPCSLGSDVGPAGRADAPRTRDVVEYLEAFYHSVTVRTMPIPLTFAAWDDEGATSSPGRRAKSKPSLPTYISLQTPTSATRVRTRKDPNGTFPMQLCLDDILDCAIGDLLPPDAYALLLLVNHDLYEGEEDDFCCGRAYGGSRVAVVSAARYRPEMDAEWGVERQHAWPASHCADYVEGLCRAHENDAPRNKKSAKRRKVEKGTTDDTSKVFAAGSALELAISAHTSALPSLSGCSRSPSSLPLTELWLSRVCRTAVHELGHCFGIDHCVYYACAMQGAASLVEDARQPPYLCPVDLAKLMAAVGGTKETIRARYKVLIAFCVKHRGTPLFDAYAAWIAGRLTEL